MRGEIVRISNFAEKIRGTTLLILFLMIIVCGFIFSIIHIQGIVTTGGRSILSALRRECSVSEVPVSFESYYNSLFSSQSLSLDAFSLTQRALGKHETRNFEVLKADDGALYLHGSEDEIDADNLHIMADECKLMYDATNRYGGHFLYVQAPFKNVGQAQELKYYSDDTTEESESYLDDLIREKGIPVLDLRDYSECKEYYNTDHHWTVRSAFNASKVIAEEIENVYDVDLDGHEHYGNIDNYVPIKYDNCFLGSIGIKVGPYFAGRDAFTAYNPKFDTDFTFQHYINNKLQFEYSGEFWETFIDQKMLEDSKYNNKYDANMHGAYVESIINNKKAENDYKGLLIAHSYGRPMAQYMCLDYSELRYLDPQEGRFNENLVDYINEYKPDIVIYMFNGIVNVGDDNWSE